jgi:hypothetical protein
VVEHLPHHTKVKGLSIPANEGTKIENDQKML